MKIGVAVDTNGFYVTDVLEGMALDEGMTLVTVPCPDGFYKPKWDGSAWVEGKSSDDILNEAKAAKIAELNQMCNQTILAGFTSSALGQEYHYPFDGEAQANLTGALALLNADPTLTTVEFKVLETGKLVDHTRDQFLQVCKDAFAFKNSMIKKYHDLKDQVEAATTIEEVNAIVWG
jgi:hypothetical protein